MFSYYHYLQCFYHSDYDNDHDDHDNHDEYDTDKDGFVDPEEWRRGRERQMDSEEKRMKTKFVDIADPVTHKISREQWISMFGSDEGLLLFGFSWKDAVRAVQENA